MAAPSDAGTLFEARSWDKNDTFRTEVRVCRYALPWWLEFWEAFLELEPDTIPVEFLPPLATSPSDTRFPSMQFGSVRALTATIAATRRFISADTGPMHLASSTAVPTVALFCASDPVL